MSSNEAINANQALQLGQELLVLPTHFNPSSSENIPHVQQVENTSNQWKSIQGSSFFPQSRATIENNTVSRLEMNTISDDLRSLGVDVSNGQSTACITAFQNFELGKNLETHISVQDTEPSSKGNLQLIHTTSKEQDMPGALSIESRAEYILSARGKEAIKKLGIFEQFRSGIGWQVEWDFTAEKWQITDEIGQEVRQLQPLEVTQLQNEGFILPDRVDLTDFTGMKINLKVYDQQVAIGLPIGPPQNDVGVAFVKGTPFVPFSVAINGKEVVPTLPKKAN